MGGKSSSKTAQTTTSAQTSLVNDGEYAGASDFVIDESETDNSIEDSYNHTVEDSYNQTYEQSIEDSYNQTYEYTDESDNSLTYTDESDNSMSVEDSFNTTTTYEDNSETSIDNSQTFVDESDNSQYFEDNRDLSQTFIDESTTDSSQTFIDESTTDNSQTFIDESDNSQYFEDNSDHSQTFIDESDNSQYFEDNRDLSQTYVDESDHSIVNDGDFAGVGGNVNILDGGVIDEAFTFADSVNAEGNATARAAIDAITDNAAQTVGIAADAITDTANNSILSAERGAANTLTAMYESLKESLGFGRSSIDALQVQSETYAEALRDNVNDFSDTLESITTSAISNAGSQVTASNQANAMQLETIAALAESTATGGASSIADASVSQVKYIAVAVAIGMAALAFK